MANKTNTDTKDPVANYDQLPASTIESCIITIRGQQVILDRDLAIFYGVETKRLNEKVKRNPKRFAGDDFTFQLTQEEFDAKKKELNI